MYNAYVCRYINVVKVFGFICIKRKYREAKKKETYPRKDLFGGGATPFPREK